MASKQKFKNNSRAEGFGMLEAVVGVAVISLSLLGAMTVSHLSQKIVGQSVRSVQASFLAEEGVEAVRIMRDLSWQNNIAPIVSGGDYYLEFGGGSWKATTTNSYVEGIFERKLILEDVYRDASDDIAASGTIDAGTKKATVYISWLGRNGTTTKSLSAYVTDLFSN